MVIYIDSLIFTNIIIDYLLLSLTSLITRRSYSLKRMVIASLVGGFASLYIFVDTYFFVDLVFQVIITSLILVVSIGKIKLKNFGISLAVYLSLSFALNGAAVLLCRFSKSDIMLQDNMVYYLNISPITLLLTTVVIYLLISLVRRFLDKKLTGEGVVLKVTLGAQEFAFEGLVDTGNTVCDPFGNSPVFIINSDSYECINLLLTEKERSLRNRVIPAKTVAETLLLNGIRCDKAVIIDQLKKYEYERPIVVAAPKKIENDYTAIIPYAVMERICD